MVSTEGRSVEFRFFRPQARQVYVVGDFNRWRTNAMPMRRRSDGYWCARARLPAGVFKFRYLADGEWFSDYAAFGVEPGPFGLDSVVRVQPRA